jgi:hypothetical protein
LVREINRLYTFINRQAQQNEKIERFKEEITTFKTAANIINTPILTKKDI